MPTGAAVEWADHLVITAVGAVACSVARMAGATPGPAVVLLHSLGLGRASWQPTAMSLAATGLTVYALDLPGHGDSAGPRTMLTIEDYGRVVRDVIDALSLGPAQVVGNSFGSVVAAEVAARYPDRVSGVVLVGCPAWVDRAAREEWLHARSQVLLTESGEPVAVTRELVAGMFPEVIEDYVATVAAGFRQAGTWLRNVMWALYAYDSAPTFARVTQPTLVVYGEHDWLQANADYLLALLPRATRATIAGGAHMTPVNRPTELAAAIAEHVRHFGVAEAV